MRVTQGMLTSQFLYNITNIYNRMQTQQNELSTGKTLNVPSDNPLAVSQDMSIRETLSQTSGYQSTISAGLSWMNNTASAVQGLIGVLQSVQTDVLSGINGANQTSAGLGALSHDVNQLTQQVKQIFDTKQGTRYLFGGTDNTGTAPSLNPNNYSGAIEYYVSQSSKITINISASQLNDSSGSSPLFTTLGNIQNDLRSNPSNLSNDLNSLQANLSNLVNLNSGLGANIRQATALQNQLNQYSATMTNEKGVIEGADMAQVITQFQTDQTVYTAALKMGAQILLPSLVSFLPNG